MKITRLLPLWVCTILINVSGISVADEKINLNVKAPLPDNAKIIAPAEDIPKEIAAFSGVWEGNWPDLGADIDLIVEEIDTQKAHVIYCRGKSSGLYTFPASCQRYQTMMKRENPQINFARGESVLYTFSMGKTSNQMKTTQKTQLDIVEIIMTRIK